MLHVHWGNQLLRCPKLTVYADIILMRGACYMSIDAYLGST